MIVALKTSRGCYGIVVDIVNGLGVIVPVVLLCMKWADVTSFIGTSINVAIVKNINRDRDAVVMTEVVTVLRTAVRSY